MFGLPSLRIKGFYLAVATLAAQFFLSWCFIRIPWLYNYNISASIEVPERMLVGIPITGPTATVVTRYLIVLTIVTVMTWLASNLIRGRIGRTWMAVRDMDIAAELIGIKLYQTKLLAFAVSSFYCGVAGAMLVFLYLGNAESESFSINQSFLVLFMVIIGGLGSLLGSFFGAALIYGLPIVLRMIKEHFGLPVTAANARAHQLHHVGNADYFVSDRRAGRLGPALADREAETEGVAFPLLKGHTHANSPVRVAMTGSGGTLSHRGTKCKSRGNNHRRHKGETRCA